MMLADLVINSTPDTVHAWRPFLDPITLTGGKWWFLLIPLAFGISMVYKAVRLHKMKRYWREVLMMTIQIIGTMILLAIGIYLFVELFVPWAEEFV